MQFYTDEPMQHPEPLTLLLANTQAEEIKLATISMRGFYPGCRVEAVFSAEEALEWASKQLWHVILLDEELPRHNGLEILPAIRERAPQSAIIVQTERTDSSHALQAMRTGADYYVFKRSPAFLTELPLITREVLEKRDLRRRLALAEERYQRLTEHISDMVYELDAQGHILKASPPLCAMLGYQPEELIGLHFSKLIHPDDLPLAENRFNERRTAERAAQQVALRLCRKGSPSSRAEAMEFNLTATGLYGKQHHFLGTLGIIRSASGRKPDLERLSRLQEQLRHTANLIEGAPADRRKTADVPTALNAVLGGINQLLRSMQGAPAEPAPETTLTPTAPSAPAHMETSTPTAPPAKAPLVPVAMNRLMEEVLSSKAKDLQTHAILVEPRLVQDLPPVLGDATKLRQLLQSLITKAEDALWNTNRGGQLRLLTRKLQAREAAAPPPLPSVPGDTSYVLVEVAEVGAELQPLPTSRRKEMDSRKDWDQLTRIAHEHGGSLEVETGQGGGLRVRVRLPGWSATPPQEAAPSRKEDDGNGHPTPTPASHRTSTAVAPAPETVRKRQTNVPERRRSPRSSVQLEARLTLQASSWSGTAVNISLHGLYVVADSSVPVSEGQQVQLGFASEVGVLEVPGTIQAVREAVPPVASLSKGPALGLAIEFGKPTAVEAQILASLLEGVCTQSVSVRLTVLLFPKESGDLLLEVSATGIDAVSPVTAVVPVLEPAESSPTERRLFSRISVAMPAHVEAFDTGSPFRQSVGTTINLSVGGACIRLYEQRDLVGRRLLLRLSPPSIPAAQIGGTQSPSQECTVTGQVVWAGPAPTAWTESEKAPAASAVWAGIRFLPLNDEAQQRIADLVGRFLTSPSRLEEWADTSRLVSELKECRNTQGRRIVLYHDHPRETLPPGSPLAVICPGYGETKKEYVSLAYFLANNGFHVLRFDYTDHVGESDGDILHSTLTRMQADLNAILEYAERIWPASPVAVIATSLAGRVALKTLARSPRSKLLLLLTPVVDVQATLSAVHQEDLIGTYAQGTRRGVINMLGFNIDADQWLEDATRFEYADLKSTLHDALQIKIPVVVFASEQDAWVRYDAVKQVAMAFGSQLRHLYFIPEALHRLNENPRKARVVFRQIVSCCTEEFYPLNVGHELAEPPQREVRLQARLERERARAQRKLAKTECLEFWRDYLSHFHYIANVSDYWHLLDHIYRLMGTCERGELILDAGCGNGNFGMFLIINQAYRHRHAQRQDSKPPVYVGLDFVPDALQQAGANLRAVAAQSWQQFVGSRLQQAPVAFSFCRADLDLPLPFRDNQFDRIVSNLVIGYLQNPLFTLRELLRVLSPNGRLVVTNLKPQADLSQIYRNFVQITTSTDEVEEGRRLLNNSGKIRAAESEGVFRFFDRQELTALLVASGASQPRIYSTFANQAYIIVAEKPGTLYTERSGVGRRPPQTSRHA